MLGQVEEGDHSVGTGRAEMEGLVARDCSPRLRKETTQYAKEVLRWKVKSQETGRGRKFAVFGT